MAAPTFVQEVETSNWSVMGGTNATPSFNVLTGDIVVVFGMTSGSNTTLTMAGGSLTWSSLQTIAVANYCWLGLWAATVDSDKSMTVTFTPSSSSDQYGGSAYTFRNSNGVGASNKNNANNAAPTLNLTTTQANSAIVVANGDWNATDGASRTWRANAGTLTERTYFRDASWYTVYGGYHADAGAIGTYAVGLSAPTGQKYSIVAVEVKGTAAAGHPAIRRFGSTRYVRDSIIRGIKRVGVH